MPGSVNAISLRRNFGNKLKNSPLRLNSCFKILFSNFKSFFLPETKDASL